MPEAYGEEEVCDGIDNNCNGQTDENTVPDEDRFFYTGDPITLTTGGDCRPGIRECKDGTIQVTPEVLPIEEVCLDLHDNDCDGLVDEPDSEPEPEMILIVMDESGSMSGVKDTVEQAICEFAQTNTTLSQIAKIGVSMEYDAIDIEFDFAPISEACNLFYYNGFGGGAEYMLDSIIDMPDLSEVPTQVIFFTDEPMQLNVLDIPAAEEECTQNDWVAHVFTYWSFQYNWQDFVQACSASGTIHDLGSAEQIRQDLETIFESTCH